MEYNRNHSYSQIVVKFPMRYVEAVGSGARSAGNFLRKALGPQGLHRVFGLRSERNLTIFQLVEIARQESDLLLSGSSSRDTKGPNRLFGWEMNLDRELGYSQGSK